VRNDFFTEPVTSSFICHIFHLKFSLQKLFE